LEAVPYLIAEDRSSLDTPVKYPLTRKNSPPILRPAESNTLSGTAKIKGVKALVLVDYIREFGKNHG